MENKADILSMTPEELSGQLHVPIRPTRGEGVELLAAMLGVSAPV